ncbi:hypothetical protein J5N97_004527 [Dioscorea zingiberensis]|uniref:ABC transporter domain-containing protein n=1 Tax=Dioscorea zingiberensis TaxID=325984 RepID=A0A9D5D6U6_9LILI|nr:hypothetical protein J5N97_004527 [Dioscorea zingiberensis]
MEPPVSSPEIGGRRTRYQIKTKSLSYSLPANSGSSIWNCNGFHQTPSRPILRDVSCEARPGELLAIVGPSGAEISGEILINGFHMDVSKFRRVSGYVSQEDTLFPLLTVKESLLYSARLRLGLKEFDSMALVHDLLKNLGLDHVAETRIGSQGGAGISGGEKRRVSIGIELVHNPSVLLLDEPTSGLDSVSALHIIGILKSMAVIQCKTIVLTIHQPGFRILELIDKLLLISGGIVRHQGSVEMLEKRLIDAGHYIPHHVNVLEFAMDSLPMSSLSSDHCSRNPQEQQQIKAKDNRILYPNSRCRETTILAERFFKNILRTRQLFTARMIQSAIVGLCLRHHLHERAQPASESRLLRLQPHLHSLLHN